MTDLTLSFSQAIWLGLSAAITLFLPGLAWLAWAPRQGKGILAGLADALGLSIAMTALGALVTYISGVHLSGAIVIGIYTLLGLVAVVGWLRHPPHFTWSWPALLKAIFGLALAAGFIFWRLLQASDLAFPTWVDSVHHVLIVRLLLENGGLPPDFSPYLPVPLFYHYGFHALAAVFAFFSRLSPDRAVLVLGQILNAAMALVLFCLTSTLFGSSAGGNKRGDSLTRSEPARPAGDGIVIGSGDRESTLAPAEIPPEKVGRSFANRAGLAAALLVILFSQMPAYYLAWGRYTLLAGLLILGVTMTNVISMSAGSSLPASARRLAGKVLTLATLVSGVLLTHYLASILLALFFIIMAFVQLLHDAASRQINWQRWALMVGSALSGLVMALPWLLRVWAYTLPNVRVSVDLPPELGGTAVIQTYASYLWYLAGPDRSRWFLGLGLLGLLWVLFDRWGAAEGRISRLSLTIWTLLIAFLALPVGVRFYPFRPDHMVILLFFPAAVLAGGLLAAGGEAVRKVTSWRWLGEGLFGLALAMLCLWGLHETRTITNPVTILAIQADRLALDWISTNTPLSARFLINGVPWQGGTYRGVDGGYWIMPYTGRQTTLPPIAYSWGAIDHMLQVNALAKQVNETKDCTPEFWSLVQSSGATYIYVRQGVGSLQPQSLNACPQLKTVYQAGGITIYRIVP
jgi:hypothetical protein